MHLLGPNSTNPWFHWRGHIAAAIVLPAFLLSLFSNPVIRMGPLVDILLQAAGWLFFLSGTAIRLWSTLYVGGRKGHTLVTEGPYSLCRNPLYLGTFLIAFSAVFFFRSLTLVAAFCLAAIPYIAIAIMTEERFLLERHGEPYLEYCRRVSRFLPNFKGFRSERMILVDVHRLRSECRRAFAWLWLPFFCQALAFFRLQPWWPAPFRLP